MIGIRCDGDMELLADKLGRSRSRRTWSSRPGSSTSSLEVVCEDDDHLLDLINKKIRALPGVRHTETFVYLKLRKQTYTWGTR